MLQKLTLSSLILRFLICINLGLPALKPVVAVVQNEGTQAISMVKDSVNVSTVKSPLYVITHPDGNNTSVLGYCIENIVGASMVLFVVFLIWGTILRVQSTKNESFNFSLTVLAIISMNVYLVVHFKELVWVFWVVYTLVMNLLIFEICILFNQQKKKLYR
jgi:hypothetical protein